MFWRPNQSVLNNLYCHGALRAHFHALNRPMNVHHRPLGSNNQFAKQNVINSTVPWPVKTSQWGKAVWWLDAIHCIKSRKPCFIKKTPVDTHNFDKPETVAYLGAALKPSVDCAKSQLHGLIVCSNHPSVKGISSAQQTSTRRIRGKFISTAHWDAALILLAATTNPEKA